YTRDVLESTGTVAAHPKRHVQACAYPMTRRTVLGSMLRLVTAMASIYGIVGGEEPVYAATLHWVGCDISKASFIDDVAAAFEQKTGHKIALEDGGATRGIRDVVAHKAEMGGSCRHALDIPEERGVKLIPVAWDALVAIVHPSNPVSDITWGQLRDVLTGKPSHWQTLGGPDGPIQVFERQGKMSGVGFGTRLLLFGNPAQEFTPRARIFDSTRPLEEALEHTPHAIAMTGISSARLRHVKMLAIEGRS